jgi:hypothetical protein
MDERVLGDVLRALDESEEPSAVMQPKIKRTIMKSPITKLAVAAAVIAVVALGLREFIGTASTSGVVWAEVARKVQASRGLIVRCTESFSAIPESLSFLNDSDYAIKYVCPTHSRTDEYVGDKIIESSYTDFTDADTDTITSVYHIHKRYMSRTFGKSEHKFLLEQHDDWMNPRYLVQTILSCEHRKLGRRTIDGILCEGIETTDPVSMGPLPEPIKLLEIQLRLWVDAETEYPVLFESKTKISAELNGEVMVMASEGVMDQFQWDVELDPSLFEPNIPPDYRDIRSR